MTRRRAVALGLCGGLAFTAAASGAGAGRAQDLSLMFTQTESWRKLSAARKTALAADFMRVFCVQQTMPPELLVTCLDKAPDGEPFDRAIGCVKQLSSSQ